MTMDADLLQLTSHLGIAAPDELLSKIEQQIDDELANLCLYDDVVPTLIQFQQSKIPIAICSNLAKPYGVVIDQLLPQFNFMQFLSYEVGYIKPDSQIYQRILDDAGFSSASCLFVVIHLLQMIRGQKTEFHTISNLSNILQLINSK